MAAKKPTKKQRAISAVKRGAKNFMEGMVETSLVMHAPQASETVRLAKQRKRLEKRAEFFTDAAKAVRASRARGKKHPLSADFKRFLKKK